MKEKVEERRGGYMSSSIMRLGRRERERVRERFRFF